jgi:hypothetical protein
MAVTNPLRDWFEAAPTSFERGEPHHEHLNVLLGDAFDFDRAWEQTLASADAVSALVAELPSKSLIVRAIVPLEPVQQLVVAVPELGVLLQEISRWTPPTLVVMPPAVAVADGRRFEEYRVGLASTLGGTLTYCVFRSLDFPDDDTWERSLMLERF